MTRTARRAPQRLTHIAATAALLLSGATGTAAAQVRLAAGDTVEVAVAGMAEPRFRAMIQTDGTVALPAVGSVAIAGLTPSELQTRMEALLPTKVLRQRLPDGREQTLVIRPGDVTASVAEYRPIYVNGDVLTPGQQAYRPLMTVRQAIAVAGGYSLLRARLTQTTVDPIDLRRDYESLSAEYAREYFHILRTHAELQGADSFDKQPPKGISMAAETLTAIVQAELGSLQVAQSDYKHERAFLETAVKQTEQQIAVLTEQEAGEEKGVQADAQELDRVVKLFSAGNLTSPRVTESRRALLLSSTRRLQTSVELMRARRQRDDYARQLDRAANQRQIALLRELKDSNVRLADVGLRLQAVSQKLQPAGLAGPAPFGGGHAHGEATVIRKAGRDWQRIAASEDTEVEPGDVIEVIFRADIMAGPSN